MDNYGNLGKTHILADAYQKINDEGRDILDKVLQKLSEGGENSAPPDFMRVAFSGDTDGEAAQGW